jgi:hypothetical protein
MFRYFSIRKIVRGARPTDALGARMWKIRARPVSPSKAIYVAQWADIPAKARRAAILRS